MDIEHLQLSERLSSLQIDTPLYSLEERRAASHQLRQRPPLTFHRDNQANRCRPNLIEREILRFEPLSKACEYHWQLSYSSRTESHGEDLII